MDEKAVQLRRALQEELPGIEFDDAVVDHFVSTDWSQASEEDEVVEAWSPFLISYSAASDEEGAWEVCRRLLARLRVEQGGSSASGAAAEPEARPTEVQGLKEWMEQLRLPINRYAANAQAWCEREGITSVRGIQDRAQDFCEALQLRALEKKRVLDGMPARRPANPAVLGLGVPDRPYSILEELGSGACARVHRCVRHTPQQPDEVFAMKIISLARLQLQQDARRARDKLQRETENLFSLRHPNIVALHDSFETGDDLYLVMELVDGGELFHHIVRNQRPSGRLAELAAGYVFRQLCDALRYIHARKIIHRDLKPENILVHSSSVFAEGKLVVKISDFGHSKIIDDGYSIAQTRCGTPQYWAPEVAAGGGRYDQKVDLWSLGVVLYVMLEGQYPFAGERAEERMREANFTPPQHASNGAKEIIRGLIQRQPEQRWTEDTCLQHRWLRDVGVPWQSEQVDDESIKLQVTPTEAETKSLRRELERFNAKYKLFPAVLRNMNQVVVTWSETSEPKSGSKEEARRELLSVLAPYCPTGEGITSGNSASGVAVGAPLATVTEEHGRRGRPSTGSGRQV